MNGHGEWNDIPSGWRGPAVYATGGSGAPAPQHMARNDASTDGLIATKDIEGCWICCCFPFFCWALYEKKATGPDTLKHAGCLFPFVFTPLMANPVLCCCPCELSEHRTRHAGTNGFYRESPCREPGNVDQYSSPNCVCNGLSCSMKLCAAP